MDTEQGSSGIRASFDRDGAIVARWATNITTYREKHGMSRTTAAAALGIHTSTLSRWESGQTVPTFGHQQRLAILFDVPVAELFPVVA